MQQHIEAFGSDLRRERRYSACSTIGYLRDVRRILARIAQQLGRPVELADLTLPTLRGWQANCANEAPATLSRQISALRALCAYLHGEGLLPEDPAVKIRRPRIPRTLPLMLDQVQAKAIVEAPRRGAYADHRLDLVLRLRDRAILEVAYGSGVRVAELAALRTDCLTFRTRMVRGRKVGELAIRVLCGKGGKQRTVVCRGAAVIAVQRYLRRRWALSPTTDHLWVGAQGRPLKIPGGGSTVQQLRWSTVDRVAQRGVTPSAGSSAITFGTVWTPLRRLTVTGIRFYWRAAGDVVTVTWWLPDGTVGRSVTVSTGGMSGIFTGTFATPLQVAAGDVGKQHAATTFDNGHYTYSVGEAAGGFPIIQRPKSSFLAGPWVQLAVYDGGSGFYATGGGYAVPNFPDGGDAHVDPIFADDVP